MKTNKLSSTSFTIMIAGGGTGGHLFPAIAIAEEILQRYPNSKIHFVGTKQGLESKIIPTTSFILHTIPVSGLYRMNWKKKIMVFFRLPFALLKCFYLLLSLKPTYVIGVGGYASGPLLLVSLFLRKKTVIQEQNAFPGLTNRILGKWVQLSFVPFSNMEHLFRKTVVVGNPIRKEIETLHMSSVKQSSSPFLITVFGGSQGAYILNKTITNMLPLFKKINRRIFFIHQTGKTDLDWVQKKYKALNKELNIEFKVLPFIEDMASTYQKSHLLICRAGSSINEIIAIGRASILVPIALSSGDHQKNNALAMQTANASIMIEEKDLTANLLYEVIFKLIENPEKIEKMEQNARKLYQGNASQKIVTTIHQYFKLD